MAYKVVDLFAGAGGLSLGFMQTGKFEIVAAAENNPGARKTYKRNHKLTRLYPDVRTIDYRELEESCGKIDVVIGGPPCQGFSNANRQHTTIISMNNRLVKEYVRAVRELEPEAFVMENVAMLKSNIHRFMVEETDIDDPIIMGLTLSEDKIELLPKGINFPDAVNFAKNSSNIKTYLWDEKELKAITVLYRFRINRPKFANSVERYRKYLTKLLTDIMASNDEDWVRTQEREMAQILIAYMNGEEIEFDALIRAIEIPLSVQRMLGRMQELLDNNIHVNEYRFENGTVIAAVQSYAVFDYIDGVLSAAPYNYDITANLERAIAESEFREYVVDVEYNRGSRGNEYAAKVLNGHNIVVDLVVHKRGYDEQRGFDNLFCIEMKKAYKRCDLSSDKERLRILTDDFLGFGYKAGFMITATADIFHDEYKLVVESYFYNRSEE